MQKYRTFLQNKLWRDRAVSLTEKMGSKVEWKQLDDSTFDKELRLKLEEETKEVMFSRSKEELKNELADLLEVMMTLARLHQISHEDIVKIQTKKRAERGGFDDRMFVVKASHPVGSFGEQYCLKDPLKYPEVL